MSSGSFSKLFQSITASTVWCEPNATRICWITMLAMADRHGVVSASIPGLAGIARISVDECRAAIATFLAPDPDSRTPEHEGRRIEVTRGGWLLLNYQLYRNMADHESVKESKRKWWNENRGKGALEQPRKTRTDSTQAEAEAEAEADKTYRTTLSGTGQKTKENNATARRLIEFLNKKTGKAFTDAPVNIEMISARLKEGATEQDCKSVIARKTREWLNDEKMAQYLRPATLFNRQKFAQYLGELVENPDV